MNIRREQGRLGCFARLKIGTASLRRETGLKNKSRFCLLVCLLTDLLRDMSKEDRGEYREYLDDSSWLARRAVLKIAALIVLIGLFAQPVIRLAVVNTDEARQMLEKSKQSMAK